MNKSYDRQQMEAICASGGYYLVLAPPGCGKTDILAERIVHAKKRGVGFDDMLCLTFTNRASRGMRDRVKEKVGEEAHNIFVGNVHRYCSHFLYDNALVPENSSIIDADEMADILMGFDSQLFTSSKLAKNVTLVDQIDAYISQRVYRQPQSSLFLPDKFDRYYQIAEKAEFDPNKVTIPTSDSFAAANGSKSGLNRIVDDHKIIKSALLYRRYKKERNLISFSDILIKAYEALRQDTAHGIKFKRYRWIQVDEVQDLNALQIAIIDELLDKSDGSFTVMYLGDEQQAIFSFIGAKLDQLERLRQRCEGHILTLGTNYRAPSYLLDILNTYAAKELGVDPALLPKSTHNVEHDKFDLILTGNDTHKDTYERITRMVQYYLGFDDERVAILVPSNSLANYVGKILADQGIMNFKISGTDMFKTKAYKTLSSFFCVNVNEFNTLAWSRLLYGIGATTTEKEARDFMAEMTGLMMTPADLLSGKSYIARFNDAYMNGEFVFFDTETTGLNALEDDIVQIAAFKVCKGQRVPGSDFNIFLHTDRDIPAKLGGTDNPLIEVYDNNPHCSREEGLKMFIDYIGDCPILGHNVSYDYNILRTNVERTLHERITFDTFDSLHLIKCVEPNLRMYKLTFLLKELHLDGTNSHLADEDIAATKVLVDYCYNRSSQVMQQQEAFISQPKVRSVIQKLDVLLLPFIENLQERLHQPVQVIGRTLADEMRSLYEHLTSMHLISELGDKFDIFLQFVQSEWVDCQNDETLSEQIGKHINDMTASIGEGDLVNSDDLISDRVFVMTVHKSKGLEFDNVIILHACDGTYPHYTVNRILNNPHRYAHDEVEQAERECREDARTFYVALSRAKKRLCVSYVSGHGQKMTPFLKCIEKYFTTGRASRNTAIPCRVISDTIKNLNGSDAAFAQDRLISFDETSHTYNVIGAGEMMPVSSVIARFFNPFDAEQASARICHDDCEAAARLREEWEARGAFASQAGSFLHKQIERYLNEKVEPQNFDCNVEYNGEHLHLCKTIDISKEWTLFKAFDKDVSYQPFRTEWSVFDRDAQMAGTIDLLCSLHDGTYEIYDWKRSKKIDPLEKNIWHSGINGLEHMPDTAYTHYCLQQNLYRYMLEKNYGIRIRRMNLVVLHPQMASYQVIPVPRMEKEVQIIVDYIKQH